MKCLGLLPVQLSLLAPGMTQRFGLLRVYICLLSSCTLPYNLTVGQRRWSMTLQGAKKAEVDGQQSQPLFHIGIARLQEAYLLKNYEESACQQQGNMTY